MTGADSAKVREIGHDPRVHVAYASRSSESYVSVKGRAEVVNDRNKIRELWSPVLKAWWESADDPAIRLVRVDVSQVEYWDTPGGSIASVLSLVKAAVTGIPDHSGENEKIYLSNTSAR